MILPNLDSLMMDEDIWGDPEVFRPERFLNSDGKLSVPTEFIPFFLGKFTSVCLISMLILIFSSGNL